MSASNETSVETRGGALKFLAHLATEVSGGVVDLPCFPNVVIRIRKVLSNPGTTPEDLVTLLGAEPRLAAKLMQTANSASLNHSGKPVTDLRTAIIRMGQQLVQSAALAFAIRQMKDASRLRSIAPRLSELWSECITVAAVAQQVARHTKLNPDEAFLTGLLHGIGRLYVLVRAVERPEESGGDPAVFDIVSGWHASIGKAVLENWGFAQPMCDAVGDQLDRERKYSRVPELTDALVVSVCLCEALQEPGPKLIQMDGIGPFLTIGLSEHDCATILAHVELQLGSLHQALGC